MRTEIEIIRTDEENHKAEIIGLSNNKVTVNNLTLKTITFWDLDDLKQCVKWI